MPNHQRFWVGFVAAASLAIAVDALAAPPQRTFVASTGNDSDPCTITQPCRGFAAAIAAVQVGGEVIALDSAGYGAFSIGKSVSVIAAPGVYAGVTVFAADGIAIVAGAADKVVLRGLSINGQGGSVGIRVKTSEVHLENLIISNLASTGIIVEGGDSVHISNTTIRSNGFGLRVAPSLGAVAVLVRDSELSSNTTAGVVVAPSSTGSAQVTVERSSVSRNAAGLNVSTSGSATATLVMTQSAATENSGAGVSSTSLGATVFVRESMIARNNVGLLQASSGVLNACGGNLLVANGAAQTGVINTSSCLDVPNTSAGLAAYGSFTNDSGPTVAIILGGTSIPMTTLVASNVTFAGTSATIAHAGVYRLSYCIMTSSNLLASSRLLINGSQLDSATISPIISRDAWCRSTATTLAAGSTVNLQLFGILGAATLLTPGGASLQIEQISG